MSRYFENLNFNDEQLVGLKRLLLGEWNDSPAGKNFKTKEDFLQSDELEIGAVGDLIFMAFFDKYDKNYNCYLLQIDDEILLETLYVKYYNILKNDKDNQHLHVLFQNWYLMEFKPLWDRLYK